MSFKNTQQRQYQSLQNLKTASLSQNDLQAIISQNQDLREENQKLIVLKEDLMRQGRKIDTEYGAEVDLIRFRMRGHSLPILRSEKRQITEIHNETKYKIKQWQNKFKASSSVEQQENQRLNEAKVQQACKKYENKRKYYETEIIRRKSEGRYGRYLKAKAKLKEYQKYNDWIQNQIQSLVQNNCEMQQQLGVSKSKGLKFHMKKKQNDLNLQITEMNYTIKQLNNQIDSWQKALIQCKFDVLLDFKRIGISKADQKIWIQKLDCMINSINQKMGEKPKNSSWLKAFQNFRIKLGDAFRDDEIVFDSNYQIVLLGKKYIASYQIDVSHSNLIIASPDVIQELFLNEFTNIPWITYRDGFKPIKTRDNRTISNDSGWGCTIRVGQMMLLYTIKRALGQVDLQIPLLRTVLDNSLESVFGIQQVISHCQNFDIYPGQWLSPIQMSWVIKSLLDSSPYNVSSIVVQDSVIFLDQIVSKASDIPVQEIQLQCICAAINTDSICWKCQKPLGQFEWKKSILLMIPLMPGLQKLNQEYHSAIQFLLDTNQSVGIIGGRKHSALYIVGYQANKLIYLDPHLLQNTIKEDEEIQLNSYKCRKPRLLSLKKAGSSIVAGFLLENFQSFQEFVNTVFKNQHRHKNIFCIEEQTPDWILNPQEESNNLESDGDFILIQKMGCFSSVDQDKKKFWPFKDWKEFPDKFSGEGIKRTNSWSAQITQMQLQSFRQQFWLNNQRGDYSVWLTIKQAVEADHETAEVLLQMQGIHTDQNITKLRDSFGNRYQIPIWVVNDPVFEDCNASDQFDTVQNITVKFRSTGFQEDVELILDSFTEIQSVKNLLMQKINAQKPVRLFFRGRELKSGQSLLEHHVPPDSVITVLV